MSTNHVVPQYASTAFNCMTCGAFAAQYWSLLTTNNIGTSRLPIAVPRFRADIPDTYAVCRCSHCNGLSFWKDESLIYPDIGNVEMPNDDLPDKVKKDYFEAANIVSKSPRGAAALLRLAIQKLCDDLVSGQKNLNTKIGELVEQGLNEKVRKALDVVRVIGNNAAHPGQIDIEDDPEVAYQLFRLINIIGQQMITEPADVDTMFDDLPDNAKKQVEKRDSK